MVSVHESIAFPFVFMICRWCYWILTHCFENLEVGWESGFGGTQKCGQGMESVNIVENVQLGESASLY